MAHQTAKVMQDYINSLQILSKLKTHIRNTILARSPRYAFYQFLDIVNRRIPLPEETLHGKIFCSDELRLEKYLNPSKNISFIDVGAKVGLWTLRLAKRCKIVHAFEPNPETFILLERNTRKLKNVNLHSCALGDENGFKEFYIHERPGYSSFVTKYADHIKTISVHVKTLDSYDLDKVDLIKIDTEGYELPILKGARETIRRKKPQLYIEIHIQDHENHIFKLLRKFGYKYSVYYLTRSYQSIIITNLED